jgi:hypothetical protein
MKLALGPIHPSMALESNGRMLVLANPFLMLLSKKVFLNNKEIHSIRIYSLPFVGKTLGLPIHTKAFLKDLKTTV